MNIARAAVLVLAVFGLALALPCSARAESVEDRLIQVSEEERDEMLSNATIGVQSGGLTAQSTEKKYPDAKLSEFNSVSDIVAALDAGKVDYALQPITSAVLYMRSHPSYTYLSEPLYSFDSCMATAKGNDELCEKLDEAVKKLKDDGTFDRVYKKWVEDGDYSTDDIPEVTDKDAETIVVAGSCTLEPGMFIQNGEPAGFIVEMVKRAAYEAGMRVEVVDCSFASSLAAVSSGKADFALSVTKNEEREKEFDFTESLYDEIWVAMTLDEDAEGTGVIDSFKTNFTSTFITENRWEMILSGLGITCGIAAGAFALATVFGAVLCWMESRGGGAAAFARGYGKIVTGIPVLVWLMLLYYVVFAGVDISAAIVAILCFGLEAAAPLSGVFSTGLASVDKGQVEAALALGFSRGEAFRRVVLPQAARAVWGLYAGQLTSLVKATSIVGYVAITDLTKVSDIIRSRTFQAFFPLVSTALIYFAVIALASWALARASRRFDPKRRKPEAVMRGLKARE